jgi:hypothetical protein
LPYFSDTQTIPYNSNHMSHSVLSALLTAASGLPPPNLRFKGEDGRLHSDFTWSHGFHPFAPFSNNTRMSALVVDAARRSSVLQVPLPITTPNPFHSPRRRCSTPPSSRRSTRCT